MQLPRVSVFTGLSSPSVQSLLILFLFARCLSTLPVATPGEKPTGNATSFPLLLPTDARPLTPSPLDDQQKLTRPMRSDSEPFDMQNSNVSMADARVDDFEQGRASSLNESAPEFSVTETLTEHSTPTLTTMASIPDILSSAATPVSTSSNVDMTTESTPADSSTSPNSPTTTIPTTITETAGTTTTMLMTTSPTSAPQTDPPDSATATALIEDSGGMPTGVVALVTMITFIIIAVIGYVSLIVWRRYLEYRYGNRELLVNDLEFDTNDLRHFEL